MVDYNLGKFNIEDKKSFELYPEIKETVILDALVGECMRYDLPTEVFNVLIEAWNSRFWVTKGYDGATIIKNKKHPSIANFIHDYHYRCGYAGLKSDVIYKELLKLTGYSNSLAIRRYGLIRVFGSFFRVRHKVRGNVSKPSFNMMELYLQLK